MRGKLETVALRGEQPRITPAHAGKTTEQQGSGIGRADHPRACGENDCMSYTRLKSSGSPPRMRGKRRQTIDNNGGARITPAHAGKTSAFFTYIFRRTDHPRACGENV